MGIFIGSTVHEVAQVVAIGNTIGGAAAHNAVIVKMIRVLMLVPFLLGLSFWLARNEPAGRKGNIAVPWFALIFVLFAALNSLLALPDTLLQVLRQAGVVSLSFSMAAFGMETHLRPDPPGRPQALAARRDPLCLPGHRRRLGQFRAARMRGSVHA